MALVRAGVAHELRPYRHDPGAPSYGLEAATAFDTVLVSAGRRGLDVSLAPDDLVRLTGARLAPIARS